MLMVILETSYLGWDQGRNKHSKVPTRSSSRSWWMVLTRYTIVVSSQMFTETRTTICHFTLWPAVSHDWYVRQLSSPLEAAILVPRAHDPSGLWQGSRALVWSNTGSPRFTDLLSNLANLIGWEFETNTLRMLRKLGPARALDPCHRPEGSWALGTGMGSSE